MSKCGSDYKIANCTLEGGLIGDVSWLNRIILSYVLIFITFLFNNNSKDSSEILIFLFPCHPRG